MYIKMEENLKVLLYSMRIWTDYFLKYKGLVKYLFCIPIPINLWLNLDECGPVSRARV